jgi:hypothetical protein
MGKNGGRLFRRPKLTLSCSAEGKEGRKEGIYTWNIGSLDLLPSRVVINTVQRSVFGTDFVI